MNAVRAEDGKLLWQTSDLGLGIAGSGRIYSTAAVAFGRVYAGDVDNRVYSYDADTGEIAWSFSAGDYVYSGIAAADTKGTGPTVYFGSHDRNVYAVDAKTGKQKWSEAAGGQISGPATVVGDVVYVSTFSGNSTIGLDLGTGRRVFSYDDGEYGPVVSDGRTLYLTGGVTVVAFEPINVGDFKYKTKKGQKGIVPPDQQRRARQSAREKAQKKQAAQDKGGTQSPAPAGDGEAAGGQGQARRAGNERRSDGADRRLAARGRSTSRSNVTSRRICRRGVTLTRSHRFRREVAPRTSIHCRTPLGTSRCPALRRPTPPPPYLTSIPASRIACFASAIE